MSALLRSEVTLPDRSPPTTGRPMNRTASCKAFYQTDNLSHISNLYLLVNSDHCLRQIICSSARSTTVGHTIAGMAEIGLIASTLGVAGAGLKMAMTLHKVASQMSDAAHQVHDLAISVSLLDDPEANR